MPKVRYTQEEKENALRLCEQIGVVKASEQTGITTKSLYKWRSGTGEEASAAAAGRGTGPAEETDLKNLGDSANRENTASVRKRYTAEEKARALRLCDEMGVARAGREMGIHVNSLRKWRSEAQTGMAEPSSPVAAAQPPKADAEQSDVLADAMCGGAAIAESPPEEAAGIDLRQAHQNGGIKEMANEELIRLRSENEALKAQILALKGALRAFTE